MDATESINTPEIINKLKQKLSNLKQEHIIIIIVILLIIIYFIYKYFKKNKECIFIYMNGCGFCEKQKNILELNNNKLNNDLSVRTIDSTCSEAQDLINKYNINGFPALIYSDKVSTGFKQPLEHLNSLTTNDITIIGNESCPFCKKMMDLLNINLGKGNYDFIDSNSDEGKKHMEKAKSNGVPLLHSKKNDKYLIGYNENYNKILNSPKVNISLVGTPSCPYCVKMKNLMDSTFGDTNYILLDSESDEGKDLMEKHKADGVPLLINNHSGKTVNGFSENAINELMAPPDVSTQDVSTQDVSTQDVPKE